MFGLIDSPTDPLKTNLQDQNRMRQCDEPFEPGLADEAFDVAVA
jgi:hypothetical protein